MINDAMLKQAAEELAIAINESLPDPKECVFQFSPKFERKMKRLTRRANHPILYRNLRMAASVLLVFLIGFGSILTVSTEARTFVFGWMRVRYQSMYEYFFEGEIENPECGMRKNLETCGMRNVEEKSIKISTVFCIKLS